MILALVPEHPPCDRERERKEIERTQKLIINEMSKVKNEKRK